MFSDICPVCPQMPGVGPYWPGFSLHSAVLYYCSTFIIFRLFSPCFSFVFLLFTIFYLVQTIWKNCPYMPLCILQQWPNSNTKCPELPLRTIRASEISSGADYSCKIISQLDGVQLPLRCRAWRFAASFAPQPKRWTGWSEVCHFGGDNQHLQRSLGSWSPKCLGHFSGSSRGLRSNGCTISLPGARTSARNEKHVPQTLRKLKQDL